MAGPMGRRIPGITDRMGPVGGRSPEAGEGPEVLKDHGVPSRISLTFMDGALSLGVLALIAPLVLLLGGPIMMFLLVSLMLCFLSFDILHGGQDVPLSGRPIFRPLGLGAGGEGPHLQESLFSSKLHQALDGFLLFTGLGLMFGALIPLGIFSLVISLQALRA
ncbi:uncharacterized protein C20orf141 homolog isoform X2 [Macrotis lagotis]|uniref:uncharacterized protein C20orf141 homolog isoform X2 n=1 Tax=Macrotis lagotis TaxID=92651 RepID=UPI003D680921